jgi:hypothetical protein
MKSGDLVRVNDPKCMTYNREASIEFYDESCAKWKINFSEQWCGWYREEQLILER